MVKWKGHYLTIVLYRAQCKDLADEACRELDRDMEARSTRFKHMRAWLRVKEERAKELVRQAVTMDAKRNTYGGEQTWWCSQRGEDKVMTHNDTV